VSPGEAGIDPAAIQLAVDYAGKRNTSALVIGRNGHIVFEKYWGDTTLDTSIARTISRKCWVRCWWVRR
jgi:hypothetical protein